MNYSSKSISFGYESDTILTFFLYIELCLCFDINKSGRFCIIMAEHFISIMYKILKFELFKIIDGNIRSIINKVLKDKVIDNKFKLTNSLDDFDRLNNIRFMIIFLS